MSLLKNFKDINQQIAQIQQQLSALQNEQIKVKQEIASETRSVLTQIIHKSSSYDVQSLDDVENFDVDKILQTLGEVETLIVNYRKKISLEQNSIENIQQKSLAINQMVNLDTPTFKTKPDTQQLFDITYQSKDDVVKLPSAMDMVQEIRGTSFDSDEIMAESNQVRLQNTFSSEHSDDLEEVEPSFEPEDDEDPNIMAEEIMEVYASEDETPKFVEFFEKNKQGIEHYLEKNTIDELIEQLVKQKLPARSLTKDRVRYFCIVNQIHMLPHVMN